MSKTIKQQFAKMGIIEAMATVKCGFELETQSFDGQAFESEPEFDEDAYDEAEANTRAELIDDNDRLVAWEVVSDGIIVVFDFSLRRIRSYLSDHLDDMAEAAIELIKNNRGNDIEINTSECCNLSELLQDFELELDTSDYYTSSGENYFDLPNGLEAKSDSSVSGPEIVTEDGGVTSNEFSELLKELCKTKMIVDVNCSFHIHVSIPGIQHSYGEKFQALLYEYLWENWDRVPSSVKERWASGSVRYFEPRISKDKFSFVHMHGQGTWEFRCFGNIDNHKDGMRCLKLAVEALQFAYRVQLGMQVSKYTDITLNNKFNLLVGNDDLKPAQRELAIKKTLKRRSRIKHEEIANKLKQELTAA